VTERPGAHHVPPPSPEPFLPRPLIRAAAFMLVWLLGFVMGWIVVALPPQWAVALLVLVALLAGLVVGGGYAAYRMSRDAHRALLHRHDH
jgi:hypothetical protein